MNKIIGGLAHVTYWKTIVEFSADAYYNGEFIKVSNDDLQGKWAIFVSIPLISHLFAQRNLVIYKNNMQSFKTWC